jgi:predicted NBD/HSP70 family sugar kinase
MYDSTLRRACSRNHLRWDNFPLQDFLTDKLDAPCIIDNNANTAALDGKVYYGGTGMASKIRHMLSDLPGYLGIDHAS